MPLSLLWASDFFLKFGWVWFGVVEKELDGVFGGGILMLIAVNSVCHYDPVLGGPLGPPLRLWASDFSS